MPPLRKRTALPVSQRKALRQHARRNAGQTQQQLRIWFEKEFQRVITQPTISESLSSKFSYLDEPTNELPTAQKRNRQPQWPELEKALYQWCQDVELQGSITGGMIKSKAVVLWQKLPPYQGMEVPVFSNGWLQGFKQRHNIRLRAKHGQDPEEPSGDDDEEEVIPKVSETAALEALNILRLYEMQQEDGQHQVVDLLDQHEAYIRRRNMNSLRQRSIHPSRDPGQVHNLDMAM